MLDIHNDSQNTFLGPDILVIEFNKEKMDTILSSIVELPIPEKIRKISFNFDTLHFHKGILGSFYLLDENNEPISEFDLYNNSKNGKGRIKDFVRKEIEKMAETSNSIELDLADFPKGELYESHKKRLIDEEREMLYEQFEELEAEAKSPLNRFFTARILEKLLR